VWNGTDWESAGGGLSFGPVPADGSFANDLEVFQGSLYASGVFRYTSEAGSLVTVNRLARWDGVSWQPVIASTNGVETVGIETASTPYDMIVHDGKLVVVGTFNSIDAGGFVARPRIAAFTGTTWEAVGPGIPTTGTPFTVASFGSNLVVGGQFTPTNGAQGNRVVMWNGTTWSEMGAGGLPSGVRALHVHNGQLFAGCLENVAASRRYLNVWNSATSTWNTLLDESTYAAAGSLPGVYSLGTHNGQLVVGGQFNRIGLLPATNIATYDGSSFAALGQGVDGQLRSLMVANNRLYAGGFFSSLGGTSANGIASWDGNAWTALATGVSGNTAPGVFPCVYAIEDFGGEIIVGGDFTTAGTVASPHLAKWNGSTWSAFAAGATNGRVWDLHIHNGSLIAAGNFTTIGGVPALRVARWTGTTWQQLGAGLDNSTNNAQVVRLESFAGDLYAMGTFRLSGSTAIDRIARFDGTNWVPLNGGGFIGGAFDSAAMTVWDNKLVVAAQSFDLGPLEDIGGVATYDGTAWAPLALGFQGGVPRSLFVYQGQLVISGSLNPNTSNTQPVPNVWGIGTWDTAAQRWTQFGKPMLGAAYAMADFQGELFGGGNIILGAPATVGEFELPAFDPTATVMPHLARWRPASACTPSCDSIDFNGDSLFPDDLDLVDFLSVLAGGACSTNTCGDIDFNNDELFPDDSDLVAFLTVLAGGACN
jgi:trimeric autotransporter adhesin